jgi:hypothetical protein
MLTVAEKQSVAANQEMALSIEVLNPAEPRQTCTTGETQTCTLSPVSISITGAIIVAGGRNPISISSTRIAGNVLSAGTEYAFTRAMIYENNTFSDANSVLYFSLRTNVLLPVGASIVVAGLVGSGETCLQTECNKTIDGASRGIFQGQSGMFALASGTLTLRTVSKAEAGSLIEFEMAIRNRVGSQAPVTPTVQVCSHLPSAPPALPLLPMAHFVYLHVESYD